MDPHSSPETTAFPNQALKLNVIASVATSCGVPPGKPRNFLRFSPWWLTIFSQKMEIQKITGKYQFQ
jgi:hypothetical protein